MTPADFSSAIELGPDSSSAAELRPDRGSAAAPRPGSGSAVESPTSTRPAIALVITDELPDGCPPDDDLPLVLEALTAIDVPVTATVWHDPAVEWRDFDLALIRSPWDYSLRAAEFRAWLARASHQVRILNEPELIAWNMDKRYLRQLAGLGVPVIPTAYCATGPELRAALAEPPAERIVVKPTVSAGSHHTGLFRAGDPAAAALGETILAGGGVAMVQPEIPAIARGAEKAVICFDGEVSHAIAKGPILAEGGTFLGGAYAEHPEPVAITTDEAALARRALAAVADVGRPGGPQAPVLYGRLDIVTDDRLGPLLLEAEVFEPSLFLAQAEGSAARFARAVARRLG